MTVIRSDGGADDSLVDDLQTCLRSYGLAVQKVHSSTFLLAGEPLNIASDTEAVAAILCLSENVLSDRSSTDAANEIAIRFRDAPDRILAVWVGPHAGELNLPPHMEALRMIDLHGARERALVELLDVIEQWFPHRQVIDVPAALFAMTAAQWEASRDAFRSETLYPAFEQMCRSFGMTGPDEFSSSWAARYGATVDDFRPFGQQQSLRSVIEAALVTINIDRVERQQRPLRLLWWHERADRGRTRHLWADGAAVIAVDITSLFCPAIRAVIGEFPDSRQVSALISIPPYSLHTSLAEMTLREALCKVRRIENWVRDWEQGRLAGAYDAGTVLSVRGLLSHVLLSHGDGHPRREHVEAMKHAMQQPVNSLWFFPSVQQP